MSGAELLQWRRRMLQVGGRRSDLDWLLDLGGGLSWVDQQRIHLHPERVLSLTSSLHELERLWRRHLHSHEPLQYLVGRCPWRDLELQVAPGVLIPRQETELLVELALGQMAERLKFPDRQLPALQWADLGTGSGCLAVALALAMPSGSQGHGVDCSSVALEQAAANLHQAGVSSAVSLHLGSWWAPLEPFWGRLDLVVANPPYIPSGLINTLEPVVRLNEPHLALDGGVDGLDPIRLIAAGAQRALAPGGWLVLEHHHDQAEAVAQLLQSAGLDQVEAHKDLEGHWRFSAARRGGSGAPAPVA